MHQRHVPLEPLSLTQCCLPTNFITKMSTTYVHLNPTPESWRYTSLEAEWAATHDGRMPLSELFASMFVREMGQTAPHFTPFERAMFRCEDYRDRVLDFMANPSKERFISATKRLVRRFQKKPAPFIPYVPCDPVARERWERVAVSPRLHSEEYLQAIKATSPLSEVTGPVSVASLRFGAKKRVLSTNRIPKSDSECEFVDTPSREHSPRAGTTVSTVTEELPEVDFGLSVVQNGPSDTDRGIFTTDENWEAVAIFAHTPEALETGDQVAESGPFQPGMEPATDSRVPAGLSEPSGPNSGHQNRYSRYYTPLTEQYLTKHGLLEVCGARKDQNSEIFPHRQLAYCPPPVQLHPWEIPAELWAHFHSEPRVVSPMEMRDRERFCPQRSGDAGVLQISREVDGPRFEAAPFRSEGLVLQRSSDDHQQRSGEAATHRSEEVVLQSSGDDASQQISEAVPLRSQASLHPLPMEISAPHGPDSAPHHTSQVLQSGPTTPQLDFPPPPAEILSGCFYGRSRIGSSNYKALVSTFWDNFAANFSNLPLTQTQNNDMEAWLQHNRVPELVSDAEDSEADQPAPEPVISQDAFLASLNLESKLPDFLDEGEVPLESLLARRITENIVKHLFGVLGDEIRALPLPEEREKAATKFIRSQIARLNALDLEYRAKAVAALEEERREEEFSKARFQRRRGLYDAVQISPSASSEAEIGRTEVDQSIPVSNSDEGCPEFAESGDADLTKGDGEDSYLISEGKAEEGGISEAKDSVAVPKEDVSSLREPVSKLTLVEGESNLGRGPLIAKASGLPVLLDFGVKQQEGFENSERGGMREVLRGILRTMRKGVQKMRREKKAEKEKAKEENEEDKQTKEEKEKEMIYEEMTKKELLNEEMINEEILNDEKRRTREGKKQMKRNEDIEHGPVRIKRARATKLFGSGTIPAAGPSLALYSANQRSAIQSPPRVSSESSFEPSKSRLSVIPTKDDTTSSNDNDNEHESSDGKERPFCCKKHDKKCDTACDTLCDTAFDTLLDLYNERLSDTSSFSSEAPRSVKHCSFVPEPEFRFFVEKSSSCTLFLEPTSLFAADVDFWTKTPLQTTTAAKPISKLVKAVTGFSEWGPALEDEKEPKTGPSEPIFEDSLLDDDTISSEEPIGDVETLSTEESLSFTTRIEFRALLKEGKKVISALAETKPEARRIAHRISELHSFVTGLLNQHYLEERHAYWHREQGRFPAHFEAHCMAFHAILEDVKRAFLEVLEACQRRKLLFEYVDPFLNRCREADAKLSPRAYKKGWNDQLYEIIDDLTELPEYEELSKHKEVIEKALKLVEEKSEIAALFQMGLLDTETACLQYKWSTLQRRWRRPVGAKRVKYVVGSLQEKELWGNYAKYCWWIPKLVV